MTVLLAPKEGVTDAGLRISYSPDSLNLSFGDTNDFGLC